MSELVLEVTTSALEETEPSHKKAKIQEQHHQEIQSIQQAILSSSDVDGIIYPAIALVIAEMSYGHQLDCEQSDCEEMIDLTQNAITHCQSCETYLCSKCQNDTFCENNNHCTKCTDEYHLIKCYQCIIASSSCNIQDSFISKLCLKCNPDNITKDCTDFCNICYEFRCNPCAGYFPIENVFYDCFNVSCFKTICWNCYVDNDKHQWSMCCNEHYCEEHQCINNNLHQNPQCYK